MSLTSSSLLIKAATLIVAYIAFVSGTNPFELGNGLKSYYEQYAIDKELPLARGETLYFVANEATDRITIHSLPNGGFLEVNDAQGWDLIWSSPIAPNRKFKALTPIFWEPAFNGLERFVRVRLPVTNDPDIKGRCGFYFHEVAEVYDEKLQLIWRSGGSSSSNKQMVK